MFSDHRFGSHQAHRVRMGGMIEDILCCTLFHNTARIHDHDVIRHLRDHAQVMGDQHDRRIDAVLQVPEQIQDLRLDRHIQCSRRLIGYDDLRIAGQRHGDHDPLPHTTGQFMGIHAVYTLTVGDSDHLQGLDRALLDLFLRLALAIMKRNDFIHLIADPEDRIQGCHGFLEDHGNHIAPDGLHLLLRDLRYLIGFISKVQTDLSRDDLPLRSLHQLHQRQTGYRLTAAGLTDYTDRLSDRYTEGYAVHTVNSTAVCKEESMQVIKLNRIAGIMHRRQVL